MTIVRQTITDGCEVRPMTAKILQQLSSFKNICKLLRTITEPVLTMK